MTVIAFIEIDLAYPLFQSSISVHIVLVYWQLCMNIAIGSVSLLFL